MTPDEQRDFLSGLSQFVREQVAKEVAKALEAHIHLGSWTENKVYRQHNEVMLGGSTWRCVIKETMLRPSTNEPLHWVLVTKCGRDAPKHHLAMA